MKDEGDIEVFYDLASKTFDSVMLVEYKDLA